MKAQNLWRSFALLLAAALLLAGIPAVSAISQEGIKEYPAEGGNIYVDGNTVVDADETITKVEIPEENGEHEIIAIGHDAFAGCSGLETVVFPASVHLITYGSFAGCTSLKSLYFEGNRPYMEDEEEFRDAAEDLTIYYIEGTTGWDEAPWNQYPQKTWEKAPDPLYTPYPVENGNIYINTTTGFVVGVDSTVTAVDIPNQVGGAAVIGIEKEIFVHCPELVRVTVPATVTQIQLPNFYHCDLLTEVQVAAGNPSYSSLNGIVYNADRTELVCIPGGITGAYQFPETVTSIHPDALYRSRITSITIPACITDLPQGVFVDCRQLEEIQVEEGHPRYQSMDGFLCDKDGTLIATPRKIGGTLELPEGIQALSSESDYCLNFHNVRIPASVTKMETHAIIGCDALENVYFMGDAPVVVEQDAIFNFSIRMTIFFREEAQGWSAPTWQGYDTAVWDTYPEYPWTSPFVDVRPGQWYFNSVGFAVEHELMDGMGYGKFCPNDTMTRGMMVTVLYRLAGEPQVSTGENPFSDVSMDRYFGKAVLWASQNQLVLGRGNGIFDPDGTISRQDMVTVFYRYAKLMEYRTDATGDLGKFPDSGRVSGYAKNAMAWAVGAGLINGMTSGNACILSPTASSTRAQVATVFQRFVEQVAS